VIKDVRALPALIAALKDPHWRVRIAATIALESLGDARAIESLRVVLKDETEGVRQQVEKSLLALGRQDEKKDQGQLAKGFDEVIAAIAPNGPALYVQDRDRAFSWYTQKGFPQHDHNDETWLTWYDGMAQQADQKGIWDEAWAAFHHALAGYLSKNAIDIPRICWRLGGRTSPGKIMIWLHCIWKQVSVSVTPNRIST